MSGPRAVDVMGFAGGFTLGVVQAGFELVGKRELGQFGVRNCEVNRHLLGDGWQTEVSGNGAWSVPAGGADLVFGNPPCSGFSIQTRHDYRAATAPINSCMWHLAGYAGRVAPPVVVMESVRLAFAKGRELMRQLRQLVELQSGHRYGLWHVMQNALELGGCARRPRYFLVLSRVPFGVDYPPVRSTVLRDAIEDLADLPLSWLPQPYAAPPTWWSADKRAPWGLVDGHETISQPAMTRVLDVVHAMTALDPELAATWPAAWELPRLLREFDERHGYLPHTWYQQRLELYRRPKNDYDNAFSRYKRWDPDKHALTITGSTLRTALHPWLPRALTVREVARVMGFPDAWLISPLAAQRGAPETWGKGVTVQVGRWVAGWARRSLEGAPGPVTGREIGEREWLVERPPVATAARGDMVVPESGAPAGVAATA